MAISDIAKTPLARSSRIMMNASDITEGIARISQTVREERRWDSTAVDVASHTRAVSATSVMKTMLQPIFMMRSPAVLRQRLAHTSTWRWELRLRPSLERCQNADGRRSVPDDLR